MHTLWTTTRQQPDSNKLENPSVCLLQFLSLRGETRAATDAGLGKFLVREARVQDPLGNALRLERFPRIVAAFHWPAADGRLQGIGTLGNRFVVLVDDLRAHRRQTERREPVVELAVGNQVVDGHSFGNVTHERHPHQAVHSDELPLVRGVRVGLSGIGDGCVHVAPPVAAWLLGLHTPARRDAQVCDGANFHSSIVVDGPAPSLSAGGGSSGGAALSF